MSRPNFRPIGMLNGQQYIPLAITGRNYSGELLAFHRRPAQDVFPIGPRFGEAPWHDCACGIVFPQPRGNPAGWQHSGCWRNVARTGLTAFDVAADGNNPAAPGWCRWTKAAERWIVSRAGSRRLRACPSARIAERCFAITAPDSGRKAHSGAERRDRNRARGCARRRAALFG